MIPALTNEQRKEAARKAAEFRKHRASVLNKVRHGELSLPEVLNIAEQDEVIAGCKVFNLIKAVPRYGTTKSEQVMHDLKIAKSRRIRGLGQKQKEALIDQFSN